MKVPGTFVALPVTQQKIPPHVWLMAAAMLNKERQQNGNAPNAGAKTKERTENET